MEATSIYRASRVLRALHIHLGERKCRVCVSMEQTSLKRQQMSWDLSLYRMIIQSKKNSRCKGLELVCVWVGGEKGGGSFYHLPQFYKWGL